MSQPTFSRAPGSHFQPTPSRTPSLSLNLPQDPFNAFSLPTSTSPSTSPQDFRTTFSGGARSPALVPGSGGGALSEVNRSKSPHPSFGVIDTAKPYPLVERRSFRDASSQGDVVVSREQLAANGNDQGSAGAGAIGERRKSNVAPGAIGDARPSPQLERTQEEFALGLPSGTLESLAALQPRSDDLRSSDGGKSRPSSFILDVLPQSRERGGSTTPSLSLDSASQPPSTSSTSDVPFLHSPNSLAPTPQLSSSSFFQNPNLASSTTSLGAFQQGGGNGFSRTSSPGPLDHTGLANMNVGSSSYDSLSAKVNTLESTVTELSTFLTTEFRSLREEVGLLRSLVLQDRQASSSTAPQQRPPLDHRYSSNLSNSHDRETDSPLLTLRSPSPHHSPAFPAPIPLSRGPSFQGSNHSHSTLLASTSPSAPPPSQSPGYFNAFSPPAQDPRYRSTNVAPQDDTKDEQIKLLTQQVNSLSSTVSNLLSNASSSTSSSNNISSSSTAQQGPMSVGMMSRQMSLPVPMHGDSVSSAGWKRAEGQAGLGVSGSSSSSSSALMLNGTGGGGKNGGGPSNGMMRSMSQGGVGSQLGRSASLRSASSSQAQNQQRLEHGTFDTISSSSAWDGGMSSPMLGAGPSSAMNSPMLGGSSGGVAGATSNPPGSLGSKWELLGIGNEVFRAIAKYGLGPPTKIQSKSIPCVVRGQDVVAQAPAIQERIQSYVIPTIQIIFNHVFQQQQSFETPSPLFRGIQAIVITATVDQAAQAQRLAVGLGGSLGIRTSLCAGASGSGDLQNELQTLLKAPPHILVGTPQKLLDLFSTRALPTSDVRLLVIDECDQLIARNLSEHVLQLAKLLPPPSTTSSNLPTNGSPVLPRSPLPGSLDSPAFSSPMARFGSNASLSNSNSASSSNAVERQMAIFSCTVPQDVLNFATSLQLKEPVKVLVRRENGGDSASPSMRSLKQYYLYLAVGAAANKSKAVGAGRREAGNVREWKLEALADLCEDHPFDHAVIFASSLETVDAIQYKLGTRAIEAYALHQDLSTSARQQIIAKFRSSAPNRPGLSPKRVLIIFDALSRNLADVQQVGLVINFDLPRAVEDYIHRISCAATSSFNSKQPSMILNIVTPNDVEMLRAVESFYRCKIQELPANFATSSTSSSQQQL